MRRLFFAAALLVSVSVFSAEYKNFKEAMKDVNEKVKAKDYSAARVAVGDAEKMAQKPADFVDVKMILARIALNENDFASARKLYQEAFALPEIDEKQRFNILTQIADTYSKENNVAEYKKAIAVLLPMEGSDATKKNLLLGVIRLLKKQSDDASEIFVYENILNLKEVESKVKNEAYLKLAVLTARRQDSAALESLMKKIIADADADASVKSTANAVLVSMDALKNGTSVSFESLDKNAPKASEGFAAKDKYASLNEAARLMTVLRKYQAANELMAAADKLGVRKAEKVYKCRFMEQVPLGAGGWFLSDFIKDKANRESRFEDYDQRSANMLFTDVAADRSVSGNTKKDVYFANTAFFMAYDIAGWHMFVLCGEPELKDILADGRGAGALEMYFSRGATGETYNQWIVRLPDGKLDSYDWNSPHRFFRSMKDYFKSDTVTYNGQIGTYIFVPWEALYDKLPLDGAKWPFGFIRWTPAGGITWGGRVHEIGQWGLVEWEKPSPEQALTIRKNIVRKAFGKYKKSREVATTHWTDKMLGDPQFYSECVEPVIQRLNKCGDSLKDIEKMNSQEVDALFKDAVPDWMEFDYLVSELRSRYLQNRILAK